jgi:hypothetical protein
LTGNPGKSYKTHSTSIKNLQEKTRQLSTTQEKTRTGIKNLQEKKDETILKWLY